MTSENIYRPEPVGEFTLEWLVRELNRISYDLEDLHMSGYDFGLEVARGNVSGMSKVNKFGRATDCDSADGYVDVWDGQAGGTNTWIAPTQARTHQIASTSASDDGAPAGVGARTIQVYGLTDWDTKEVSETITMNGTTNVATANSYVIIHRMKVLTKGATNVNVGVISATADTDATVTAQINVGEGQTQMAIYGVPSVQTAYLSSYYSSAVKGVTTTSIGISLLNNPEPDSELLNFQTKHTQGLSTDGSAYIQHIANPPMTFSGPCILKIQADSSVNNSDVSAGFDLYLEDN